MKDKDGNFFYPHPGMTKEMQTVGHLTAQIEANRMSLDVLRAHIIKTYCPYKKGQRIDYKLADKSKFQRGVLKSAAIHPLGADNGIDGIWLLTIHPVGADLKPKTDTALVGLSPGDLIQLKSKAK